MFPFTFNTFKSYVIQSTNSKKQRQVLFLMNKHYLKYILPLLPSGGIVLNLKTETKILFTTTDCCGKVTHIPQSPKELLHFQQEYVPVHSHRSCCSFFAFVLKGNQSVGAHVPGPGFDLIERKLKKILLEDNNVYILPREETTGKYVTLITRQTTRVYLCELKGPVRQKRCDPIGTFGQVAVKLGRRFDSILRHVLVDVLDSALRNKTYWWAWSSPRTWKKNCQHHRNKQKESHTLITLKTIMSPDEPTSKGLICNKSEHLER